MRREFDKKDFSMTEVFGVFTALAEVGVDPEDFKLIRSNRGLAIAIVALLRHFRFNQRDPVLSCDMLTFSCIAHKVQELFGESFVLMDNQRGVRLYAERPDKVADCKGEVNKKPYPNGYESRVPFKDGKILQAIAKTENHQFLDGLLGGEGHKESLHGLKEGEALYRVTSPIHST